MGLRNLFKRKPTTQREKPETQSVSDSIADASALPYVESQSALQYPGVKVKEKPQPPSSPKAVEIPRQVSALPRCPKCGWSVGYMDEKCSNCGYLLRNR